MLKVYCCLAPVVQLTSNSSYYYFFKPCRSHSKTIAAVARNKSYLWCRNKGLNGYHVLAGIEKPTIHIVSHHEALVVRHVRWRDYFYDIFHNSSIKWFWIINSFCPCRNAVWAFNMYSHMRIFTDINYQTLEGKKKSRRQVLNPIHLGISRSCHMQWRIHVCDVSSK